MKYATADDYKWLYAHTDYMQTQPDKRWDYWRDIILEKTADRNVNEHGAGRQFPFMQWLLNNQTKPFAYYGSDIALGVAAHVNAASHYCIRNHINLSFDVAEHVEQPPFMQTMGNHLHAVANMSDPHMVDGEMKELHVIQENADWWVDRVMSWGSRHVKVHHWRDDCRFLLEYTI